MSSGYDPSWREFKVGEKPAKKKRSKYRAVPHVVLPDMLILQADECAAVPGGLRFASRREAERFRSLIGEQESGAIANLELQPTFPLHTTSPSGVKVRIGNYIADFAYQRGGQRIVEDAKGIKTAVYERSKKHAEAEYGIRILET